MMQVEGVVMNGRVIASLPETWAEGTRVSVALLEEIDPDEELDKLPVSPESETHEEFVESLRQEIADIEGGIRGLPLDEAFAQIAAELKLPKVPRE